jgi:hypothetical protein
MTTSTNFYGPLEITHYGDGTADVFRCQVTLDGVTHSHVATLEQIGRQWRVVSPDRVELGWVRRNAWQRWEALAGGPPVLVACRPTMEAAISAVLEGS